MAAAVAAGMEEHDEDEEEEVEVGGCRHLDTFPGRGFRGRDAADPLGACPSCEPGPAPSPFC